MCRRPPGSPGLGGGRRTSSAAGETVLRGSRARDQGNHDPSGEDNTSCARCEMKGVIQPPEQVPDDLLHSDREERGAGLSIPVGLCNNRVYRSLKKTTYSKTCV